MSEYELVPVDPLRKLENEIEELKQYIKSLKENTSEIKEENKNGNSYIEMLIKMNQDIINSLIRSNIELQSKISELIVVTSDLNREIKKLLEIFKEAALEYMEKIKSGKKEEKEEVSNLDRRFEEVEKINLKILEALEKLNSNIEDLKKSIKEKSIERPKILPPPKLPPRPPFPPKL